MPDSWDFSEFSKKSTTANRREMRRVESPSITPTKAWFVDGATNAASRELVIEMLHGRGVWLASDNGSTWYINARRKSHEIKREVGRALLLLFRNCSNYSEGCCGGTRPSSKLRKPSCIKGFLNVTKLGQAFWDMDLQKLYPKDGYLWFDLPICTGNNTACWMAGFGITFAPLVEYLYIKTRSQ